MLLAFEVQMRSNVLKGLKHEAKELYIYPKKEEILKGLKHRMRCYLSLGSPETRTWDENLDAVQFNSVTQSCPILYDPMNCSTPGLLVHHRLPESSQTHVHWVSDAIQPSHLLLYPSSPALNLSQQQGLFQWVSSLYQVAKVLEFQLQYQSFKWTPGLIFRMELVGSPCSPRDSQESSPTPQFKSINSSVLSFLHSPTLTSIHDHWKNHSLD